jgi:hypothetical protein
MLQRNTKRGGKEIREGMKTKRRKETCKRKKEEGREEERWIEISDLKARVSISVHFKPQKWSTEWHASHTPQK